MLTAWGGRLKLTMKEDMREAPEECVEWAKFLTNDPYRTTKEKVLACFTALSDEYNSKNKEIKEFEKSLKNLRSQRQDNIEEGILENAEINVEISELEEKKATSKKRAELLYSRGKNLRTVWLETVQSIIDSAVECITRLDMVISSNDTPITVAFRDVGKRKKEREKSKVMLVGLDESFQDHAERELFWNASGEALGKVITMINDQLVREDILDSPQNSEVQSVDEESIIAEENENMDEIDLTDSEDILATKRKIFDEIKTRLGVSYELDKKNTREVLGKENEEALKMADEMSKMIMESLISALRYGVVRVPFTTHHNNERTTRVLLTHLFAYFTAEKSATDEMIIALKKIKARKDQQHATLKLYRVALKKEQATFERELGRLREEKTENRQLKKDLEELKARLKKEKKKIEKDCVDIVSDLGDRGCVIC